MLRLSKKVMPVKSFVWLKPKIKLKLSKKVMPVKLLPQSLPTPMWSPLLLNAQPLGLGTKTLSDRNMTI